MISSQKTLPRTLSGPLLALSALLSACTPASTRPKEPATSVVSPRRSAPDTTLGWLEGRWIGSQDGIETEEHWTSASGRALLGMHKDVKNGKMTSFEFLRIEDTEKGLVFFASPRSAPVTPFPMIESGDRRIVFANPEHDFPQRILYWLDEAGALHARVEGKLRGESQSEEWVWRKN
ncbi:MAG: DUF6265 family protein [Polyangiaceae bacterium]